MSESDFLLNLIIKRPLISLIVLSGSCIILFTFMWYLSGYEYNGAMKNPDKILRCGLYQGVIRENGKTNLHKDYFYRSIVFDGNQLPSRVNSFNFGQNKFYKQQLDSVKNGDRVCLMISNGVVVEFNIQK